MRTLLEVDHLVTAEEFAGMQDSGYRWELVEGRVFRMSHPGMRHGVIAAHVAAVLREYALRTGAGFALGEAGYRLTWNPDTVRGPDCSFLRKGCVPESGIPIGWGHGAPDLAVEIVSPDNRRPEMRRKLAYYFDRGALMAWVVEPDDKTVTVYRPHSQPQTLGIADTLDGGDVLPGFNCAVAEFFAGL